MALKVTSGAWVSASQENKVQRDGARKAFFADAGVQPQRTLRDLHIPLASRLGKVHEQIGHVDSNRIGDAGLTECAELAKAMLALGGLGIASVPMGVEHRTFGLAGLSPEVLKRFFVTDQETSLEKSLF